MIDLSPNLAGLIGVVPLLILFVGLGFTRLPAHVVALGTALLAVGLAGIFWNASAPLLLWSAGEGMVTALIPILWVVFAAVFVFLVSTATGGMEAFRHFLAGLAPSRELQVVLVAFCLGGFLEAVAGFGTAVAIPAAVAYNAFARANRNTLARLNAFAYDVFAFLATGVKTSPMLTDARATSEKVIELARAQTLQGA